MNRREIIRTTSMGGLGLRTGERVTFDEKSREVMAGRKVFHL